MTARPYQTRANRLFLPISGRFYFSSWQPQGKIEVSRLFRTRLNQWVALMGVIMLALPTYAFAQPTVDHAGWHALLRRHVNEQRLVDYVALQQERAVLDAYLASLAEAQPSSWSKDGQLAFWINAYNACVFKGVLDHSPLKSVRDVKGFFEKLTYPVAGEPLTLNAIEAKGRALGDWRLHVGVVCASSSCPILRAEAYQPGRLTQQLDEQAVRFLNDQTRGFRVEGTSMWVSKIFQWYAKDFVPSGPVTPATLWPLIDRYITREESFFTDPNRLTLKFLDYDWTLNQQGGDG